MSLTPEQREEYADMLARGVPEDVIAEFDARATRYIDEWGEKVVAEFVKKKKEAK